MKHSFDVSIATKYGFAEAILVENLFFWAKKNAANERHFHDGKYWTYNSRKAFSRLFPYIGEKSIERALTHLVDEGILLKGNYNEDKFDKTSWYAFTDAGEVLMSETVDFSDTDKLSTSIGQIVQSTGQNVPPIPYINNTDNKPVNIPSLREGSSHSSWDLEHCITLWNSLKDLGVPSIVDIKEDTERGRLVKKRSAQYSIEDYETAVQNIRDSTFLQGQNDRGWTITFDWFIKPNNFAKVLEGNYVEKEKKPTKGYDQDEFQKNMMARLKRLGLGNDTE